MTNNQLSTQAQATGNGQVTVYQQFRDPMEGINKLAEYYQTSGMVKNPGQAGIYAFACFCRGEDPFDIVAENMIVDGKLTRKYDMMLVDLRNAGGDYRWVRDGEDGVAATIEITWRNRKQEYTYTMEMAKKRGLYDRNPNYKTQPGNMLRSKAVREGFRMYCPEVVGGLYTPEDANETAESSPALYRQLAPTAAPTHQPPAPRETTAAEDAPFEVEGEVVVETQAQDTETATEPQSNGNGRVTRERMQELASKARQLGMTGPQIKDRICKAANVSDPSEITMEQATEIIAKLDAKMQEKVAAGN